MNDKTRKNLNHMIPKIVVKENKLIINNKTMMMIIKINSFQKKKQNKQLHFFKIPKYLIFLKHLNQKQS